MLEQTGINGTTSILERVYSQGNYLKKKEDQMIYFGATPEAAKELLTGLGEKKAPRTPEAILQDVSIYKGGMWGVMVDDIKRKKHKAGTTVRTTEVLSTEKVDEGLLVQTKNTLYLVIDKYVRDYRFLHSDQ